MVVRAGVYRFNDAGVAVAAWATYPVVKLAEHEGVGPHVGCEVEVELSRVVVACLEPSGKHMVEARTAVVVMAGTSNIVCVECVDLKVP